MFVRAEDFLKEPHLKKYTIDYFTTQRALMESKEEKFAPVNFDVVMQTLPRDIAQVADQFSEAQKTEICKLKLKWSNHSDYVTWLANVENLIVDAHRSPEDRTNVTLDTNIRNENRDYVKHQGTVNNGIKKAFFNYLNQCVDHLSEQQQVARPPSPRPR